MVMMLALCCVKLAFVKKNVCGVCGSRRRFVLLCCLSEEANNKAICQLNHSSTFAHSKQKKIFCSYFMLQRATEKKVLNA